jgi:hypothetical protein
MWNGDPTVWEGNGMVINKTNTEHLMLIYKSPILTSGGSCIQFCEFHGTFLILIVVNFESK